MQFVLRLVVLPIACRSQCNVVIVSEEGWAKSTGGFSPEKDSIGTEKENPR